MCLRISPPCGADNSTCQDLSGPASPASLLATSTNIAFLAVDGKSWNDEKEGTRVYVAPFAHHVGIFPPVKGDAALEKALANHRGEKGTLRLPLDQAMP